MMTSKVGVSKPISGNAHCNPKSKSTGSLEGVPQEETIRRTSSAAEQGKLNTAPMPRHSISQARKIEVIEKRIEEDQKDNRLPYNWSDEIACQYYEGKARGDGGNARFFRIDWNIKK